MAADLGKIDPAAASNAEARDPLGILSALDAVVYDWDIASDRLIWSPNAASTLRGLSTEQLATGAAYAERLAEGSETSRYLAVFGDTRADPGEGVAYRVEYFLRDGSETVRVEDFGRWFADASGRPRRAHGLVRVLGRATPAPADGETKFSSTFCSRRDFNAWVDQRCAEPRAPDSALALMVVGLANLAEINAHEGYDAGDELIAGVGRRLALSLRGGDKVVRYSGARFAILVALSAGDQPAIAAARLARRVGAELYPTSAGGLRASARVGVALSPRHGRSAHLLLQRADEAYAETSGAVAVYAADEQRAQALQRDRWVADEIVAALNERRILLAFQKIAPTNAAAPPFEEALVRLRLDDGTLIGPEAIVPVAEKMGLIELVDERVQELVVERLAAEPDCRLSMNVSVATLRGAEWFERLRDRLAAAPGAAGRLTVEIVETQAVDNAAQLASVLVRVKGLGSRVAMDDFGAGHTSFRNLRGLGVDMVKIDGAFVTGLATSADDRFFVRTLAELARHLGIVTVAEWVEDEETARLLKEWGVDYLQGNLIGRAEVPGAEPAGTTAERASR